MGNQHTPNDILDFWFSNRVKKLWFNSTPEFDCELKDKFEPTLKRAIAGELTGWVQTPEAVLALVIVLDQFPLNMYRGKAEAFGTGELAVTIAKAAIAQGFDRSLSRAQLAFLYLPFMHSERLSDQEQGLELFARAALTDNLKFAKHHCELIRRFGRFPHRNALLGRANTPDEDAYLTSKEAFRG